MSAIQNLKIAVIGGGPGGLTLARLLQVAGAGVSVYERDLHENARPKGATLDLHEESGLLALQEAGLMDAFNANYRPGADKLRIVDKAARVIFDDHANTALSDSRPEIDRGPLQKLLLDSLKPGTVVWDRRAVSLTARDKGWDINFENNSSVYADLVIAADGANSKLRPYLTPITPFYSGITVVEGMVMDSAHNTPAIHKLLNGGKLFVLGDSKSLIVSSKGDGSLVFYTGCSQEESWATESGIDFNNREEVLHWFNTAYTGWDPVWQELFTRSTGSFVPRPQYCMPFDQQWKSLPNLSILGDAAHVMPPYAGEGVNMAMLDALELSRCLTGDFGDTAAAVAAYETAMRQRASETAQATMVSTDALHAPEAIAWFLDIIR